MFFRWDTTRTLRRARAASLPPPLTLWQSVWRRTLRISVTSTTVASRGAWWRWRGDAPSSTTRRPSLVHNHQILYCDYVDQNSFLYIWASNHWGDPVIDFVSSDLRVWRTNPGSVFDYDPAEDNIQSRSLHMMSGVLRHSLVIAFKKQTLFKLGFRYASLIWSMKFVNL